MINLLHFQFLPHVPTVTAVAVLSSVAAILILSRVGSELFENTVGTICGWFETKTPDAPTAKPSSVTTGYIFGQRAVYVGRNYPAKTPDTDSLETPDEQAFSRWLVQLWYGESCSRPPCGWFCTRGKGHTGPCPARPVPARQIPDPTTETAPAKRCHWCLDGHPRCWVNGEAFHDGLGFSWRCDETRKASMPAVLGAPYDLSPAAAAFFGAPPSVNDTVAAPNFVVPEPNYKTCQCAGCKDFRNRVFKTTPVRSALPHDEFAARAWQAEQRAAIKREQGLDEARLYLHNQKNCKHPKGFQYLGRCPVCFMAGDDLR